VTQRLSASIERQVRRRAREICEYCRFPQALFRLPFEIEHIVARKHQGTDALDNLCLACPYCNRFKGPNIAGVDPVTEQITRLFNPRTDEWHEHFRWEGPVLFGLTAIGRTTIAVLAINLPLHVAIRERLILEGVFPLE
jgi:hypothetical protein